MNGCPLEKSEPLKDCRNTNLANLIKALDELGWGILEYTQRDSYGDRIALMIQRDPTPKASGL